MTAPKFAYPATLPDGRPVAWRPLQGFQVKCAQCATFEALFGGAAGPGKTSVLIGLAAKYASQHARARVIFFRTVYKDTLDLRDRMMALYPQLGFAWAATEGRWTAPIGGTIQIAHAGSLREIMDYLGPEYTAVLWDELTLLPDEVVWQMILGRIRSTDPTVPLRARASANPIGPGMAWVKQRFVDVCGDRGETIYTDPESKRTRAFIFGTADDNPLLPSDYWDGLRDLPPTLQEALRVGNWNSPLGLFYPELGDFSQLLVSPKDAPSFDDWHEHWASFDWGFSHPAALTAFTRIGNIVYWRDTLYAHRFQDEEQAATIRGGIDKRCLQMVYAGPDCFAQRRAHNSAGVETVASVFDRYSIHLELANVDKLARAKVLRRMFAAAKDGPMVEGSVRLKVLDTAGNRRALQELALLVPDALNPNVPAKRDANEKGLNGDDGADALSFGLATPSLEPVEPLPVFQERNIADGQAELPPWEVLENKYRMPDEDGRIDRRVYQHRQSRVDSADSQFGEVDGW